MNHGGSIQFYGGNRSYDRSYDTLILTEVTTFLFCVCVCTHLSQKFYEKKTKHKQMWRAFIGMHICIYCRFYFVLFQLYS